MEETLTALIGIRDGSERGMRRKVDKSTVLAGSARRMTESILLRCSSLTKYRGDDYGEAQSGNADVCPKYLVGIGAAIETKVTNRFI
jgi:hypothetical protein